ncbi:MAG: TonB-dependent hemoglobin/transferrin/lactoferrin family receptor [Nitrospiria bacterium]
MRHPSEPYYGRLIAIFVMTLTLFTKAAVAQTETREEKVRLEDITVTATKSERPTIDTPESVNVITREEIERQQAQDITDLFRYEPGLDVNDSFGGSIREQVVIRGLEGNRILLSVDGKRLDFSRAHSGNINFIDVDSIERIEVIRGPASALYGSNAIGGVVSIITKDPKDLLEPGRSFGGSLKFGYNSVNDEYSEGFTLFGEASDRFSYLFGFTRRDADDIDTPAGKINSSGFDRSNFDFKGVFRPTDKDRIRLNLQFLDDTSEFPFVPDPSLQSQEEEDDTNRTLLDIGYERSDPGAALETIYLNAYAHLTDIDEIRNENRLDPTQTFIDRIRNRVREIEFDTFGGEIRGSSAFGSSNIMLRATYGVEYHRDESENVLITNDTTFTGPPPDPGTPIPTTLNTNIPNATADTFGFYYQGELSLPEWGAIIFGLRLDTWDLNATINTPGFAGTGFLLPEDKSRAANQFSPKLGIVVELMENVNLTGNYAKGFRTPSFSELFIAGPHFPGFEFVPNADLEPERSQQYEIGLKGASEKGHFSVTYFNNTVDDFIGSKIANPACFAPFGPDCQIVQRNLDEAEIRGVEASVGYYLLPEILLYGNYTDTRGDDKDANEPLDEVTPRRGLVGVRYENRCNLPWCQHFYVDLRGRFVDRQDRRPLSQGQPQPDTPGYRVFDVRSGLDVTESLQMMAAVENFTDKQYREHFSGDPSINAEGINVAVNLRYRF